MKPHDLQSLFEMFYPLTASIVKTQPQHAPTLMLFQRDAEALHGWRSVGIAQMLDVSKDAMAKRLREAKAECGPNGVCIFIMEGWIAYVTEDVDLYSGVPAKDRPGAFEAVLVDFFGAGFEYTAVCRIEAGRELAKGEIKAAPHLGGRFARVQP